jgi:prephenate dehydrogenase
MTVGVYGLGRFGAFWARLLAERFDVGAYNRSAHRPVPEGVTAASLEEVCAADILFLCVSISAIEAVVEEIAPLLSPRTVVADTCSVKVHPVQLMQERLPEENPILGTHPMFGPDSGQSGVQDLPIIITPVRTDPEMVEYWVGQFQAYGLRVHRMTPDEHDREAAYTQGITHFLGRLLKELDVRESAIGTLGYRKLLEVVEQTCNDPYRLFLDLQHYNPYTEGMRTRLRESFDLLLERLESELDTSDGRK